ncbi:hypothetical protein B1992_06270 [Pseudoxanthomonas broegbernensis]|uniref:Uncharacterized protein n=1 Tax=Pseudoxanthomonas broegbernensis TaxID=83619 RepID=A0A7V8GNA1_9GAMM|nr:hypothetical protein [Pseudoxanthomonas broegbernensis]KAF1686978.1 hypothetical protein B1992_06270 [Pseudoxanthomonas broegbernensis]MBB6065411.1 hypothetical protein [Pseudoxanthomonas broegbernensis]
MPRTLTILLALVALLLAAPGAEALNARQRTKLEQAQAVFASAVRWSDYEAAWQLVDPKVRTSEPLSDLELARYHQLQVTSYREGGNGSLPDGSVTREVEIGVVNRHTQAERRIRWREQWRWDAEGKRWWQTAGLPDFWEGD